LQNALRKVMKSFTQDVSFHVSRVMDQVLYASPRKVELFLTLLEGSFPMERASFVLLRSAAVDFHQADADPVGALPYKAYSTRDTTHP
jgi:hypothetical protein